METIYMFVKSLSVIFEEMVNIERINRCGLTHYGKAFRNSLHYFASRYVRAMQIEGKMAKSDLFESVQHDLECCTFFSNKKYSAPIGSESRNQVGNRLAFTGPRRPMDNTVLSIHNSDYHLLLA